jgi:arginase
MLCTIDINNIRCNIGQKKSGVEQGGDYLIKLFEMNKFTKHIFDLNSYDDYKKPYEHILNSNNFCINLGGDHSIGSPILQAQLDKYKDDILFIWIDAHADINTFDTSPSSNIHGMPVATLFGLMEHWWSSEKSHHKLNPNNLLYVGIRDLDSGEVDFINDLNITYFKNYSTMVNEWIQKHPAGKIHISLDIDGLDPTVMPSTGTAVDDGLNINDVIEIINQTKNRLVSFDMVEFNPLLGTDEDKDNTFNNCKIILDHVQNIINDF